MATRLKPLRDQCIVITGASSGIGLATAQLAVQKGAAVVLVARNRDALQKITEEINGTGGRAACLTADIADEGAPGRIADVAERHFGGFDTWVNNAAVALFARLGDTTLDEHRQVFNVGYFGLVNASLFAARALKTRGGGAIVNVGSILSDRSVPIQGAYSAMKHAVQGFTEALRMELEMEGAPVSVTLVKPTGVHTPYPEHARTKLNEPAAIPPIAYDPRLVAEAILFAAAHPRRTMMVGGQGIALTKLAGLFPRTTDRIMEIFFREPAQTIGQRPPRGVNDNLFHARKDGRVESEHEQYVRRGSITLRAQMHPLATAAVLGGAAMAVVGLFLGRKAVSRRRSDAVLESISHLSDNALANGGEEPLVVRKDPASTPASGASPVALS
ncbi:MAG TPA: SDR family oxidoreductase [Allosphingosinicella sp.]